LKTAPFAPDLQLENAIAENNTPQMKAHFDSGFLIFI
jgi:hypothetical protein